ncbi:MAG TPA: AMP-binding protein [Firmicutes bacterium]|nr:AMP-binding protein [Bacillota bacterium]
MFSLTLGELLDRTAATYPETEAAVFPEFGVRWTYAEFRRECERAARGFMALGLQPGEHIAIWATNRPQWLVTQFATGKMGGVLVTVNTNYKVFELEYLLSQSDATTLILIDGFKDADYLGAIYQLCPELETCRPGELHSSRLPRLRNVIFLGDEPHPGMFTWNEVLALGEGVTDGELRARQASLHCEDVINIQYTSGTTGFPKGVMLTHRNMVADATLIAECMKLTERDRLCIPVPFFHCFGCVLGTLAAVTAGSAMVCLDHFNPLKVMRAVQDERCTALHGVPTMFITILEHPDFTEYDYSSLRTGIMAGSPCPEEVMRQVIARMHLPEITIAYGQTEAAPVITQTRTDDPFDRRVATVGRALPGIEVRIVEPGTSREVPRGVIGELCCRGFNVMKGYYNLPEDTARTIDGDGWLHTGDLATMDDEGYCRITGRLKDMIIRGGENIYPREIEEYLYRHPKVADAQVVGVPSKVYGEEVMAFVRLKSGEEASETEIREYLRSRISRHKVPRYVRFVTEYPTTASGKIQKYRLREMAQAELGREQEDRESTGS